MKMEKLTKQVALLIAVVTGVGVVQAEEHKGTSQVTHHIVSGQTKHPVHKGEAHHMIKSGPIKFHHLEIPPKSEKDYLHKAIQMGSIDLAKTLIEKGMDVNEKDFRGNTPLHSLFQS